MRHSRGTGPPSTPTGSSSSGRGLVRGSHRSKGTNIPGVMVPGDPEKGPSKNRTKVIIVLGIALPVLACIIGIIAWSVTTDVLRISPRSHDNAFNRFGHQGKTRIDILQSRNDEDDIDIFQFHSITSPSPTVPSVLIKAITQKTSPKQANKPTTIAEHTTTDSPNVSDILSRLISDMPVPKNPKNFVVFAPVADALKASSPTKDRRFDGKALVHEEEDLVAEESSYSEDVSHDSPGGKIPFSRKRKSSVEESHSSKTGIMPLKGSKHGGLQGKPDGVPLSLWESSKMKSNSPINPHRKPVSSEIPLPTDKYISNSMNKKSIGVQQNQRSNMPQHSNPDFSQIRVMKLQEFQTKGNLNLGSQTAHLKVAPHLNDIKKNSRNQSLLNNSPSNPQTVRNEDKSGLKRNGNNFFQDDGRNAFQQKFSNQNQPSSGLSQGKQPFKAPISQGHTSSQNHQSQQMHNSLQQNHNSLPQKTHNPHLQQIRSPPPQQKHNPPPQQTHNPPPQQNHIPPAQQNHNTPPQQTHNPPPQQKHNPPPQQTHNPPPQQNHNPPPQQNYKPPPQRYFPATPAKVPNLSSTNGDPSFQGHILSPSHPHHHSPPSHSSSNQGPSRSTHNSNSDFAGSSYPMDNGYQSSNNAPQYYAPHPQTFHTKTSYDRPSNNHGHASSVSTYEKAAQSAVDKSKEELHHHHYHHHHHDPMTSNSDPIGDINLSDVPKTNDADRLGTIGLGLGGPRGITVQIGGGGGGGGGGGLTGLLPLGALGLVKNIVSTLLPRPTLGLNSKVFLGVEVGRGGGMMGGLLG